MWGHRTDNWTKLLAFQVKTSNNGGAAQITKEVGSGSLQLFSAYDNAAMFDEVVIEVTGPSQSNPGAGEVVVERITLTGALISTVRRYAAVESTGGSNKLLENYGLVFQRYTRLPVP